MANNQPLPPWYLDKPELWPHNELYWRGFTDLQNSRSIGMEVGPIPYQAIYDYCRSWDLSTDQTEEMLFFVRKLDYFQLGGWRAQREREQAKDTRRREKEKQRQRTRG